MSISIDLDNFDNEILNKINNEYWIKDTDDNSKNDLIIDIAMLSLYTNELEKFYRFLIIDKETKKLNIVKYNIFRKYIKREDINWVDAIDIQNFIKDLKYRWIDHKYIYWKLDKFWFDISKLTYDYEFSNSNELQIISYIILYWRELLNKLGTLKSKINNTIWVDELIVDKEILWKNCNLYKNKNFTIWNFKWNIWELNSNDKNWIIFFFVVLYKWCNKTLLDYKWTLEDFKKNILNNNRLENIITYRSNNPNRFNSYSKKNNLWIKIINDDYRWIEFYNS